MSAKKHRGTRVIHWVMAALTLLLICMGFYMTEFEAYAQYPLHKSLGVIALLAILFRLYWRSKHPWESSAAGSKQEPIVHLMHLSLLILLVLLPVSGMMHSGFGGYGVALFGAELIPHNHKADGVTQPFNAPLSAFGQRIHRVLGYSPGVLVALHILAALKHHFVDKDDTLTRMMGKNHHRY